MKREVKKAELNVKEWGQDYCTIDITRDLNSLGLKDEFNVSNLLQGSIGYGSDITFQREDLGFSIGGISGSDENFLFQGVEGHYQGESFIQRSITNIPYKESAQLLHERGEVTRISSGDLFSRNSQYDIFLELEIGEGK